MNANPCFVLGAGFSKACGLPLAGELTQLIFSRAYPPGSPQGNPTRFRYLNSLRKLYPTWNPEKDVWPDFEDLITILEEWESYRQNVAGTPPPRCAGHPAHLREVLIRRLGLCLTEAWRTRPPALARFVMHAVKANASIVSFNWDLIIECVCREMQIPVTRTADQATSLRLCKPHGSLDLVELPKEQYEQDKRLSAGYISYMTPLCQDAETVVLQAKDPTNIRNLILHRFPNKQKLIVAPAARKSYASKWIQKQWCRALEMVTQASEITVIGYSLPDTDYRSRVLLQNAVWNRSVPMKVISPDADKLLEKYRRYVPAKPEELQPVCKPWEKCIETLFD